MYSIIIISYYNQNNYSINYFFLYFFFFCQVVSPYSLSPYNSSLGAGTMAQSFTPTDEKLVLVKS